MSKVLNSDSAHGQFLSAAHTTFTGVQQGLSQMSAAAATAYKNAGAQAEAALAAFEAQYCSPATFSPSEWHGQLQSRCPPGSRRPPPPPGSPAAS